VRISKALLRRLDLAGAVEGEIANPPDRLPSRVAELAVGEHREEYAQLLSTHLRGDSDVVMHEIVWVPKARVRYRPVSSLPLDARVLYRALALDIQKECDDDLTVPAKTEFERGMLDERADPYFARADVASYYNYIDHPLIYERVVEEAARADTADALVSVLNAFLGRAFGIPQNVGASEILGELVLMPVVDRLARAGVPAYRRNDDFYLPSASWDDAIGVVEQLQTELYAIGLTLNEEKTRVWKRTTLEQNIGRVSRRLREILVEHQLDGADIEEVDEYTGEAKEPNDEEAEADTGISRDDLVGAATVLLEESLAEWRGISVGPGVSAESADDPAVARSAVLSLVRMLGRLASDAALPHGATILRTDPGTTESWVLSYLARLPADDVDFSAHVEELLNTVGPMAPAWQQAWLMDALLDVEIDLSPRLIEWLKDFVRSRYPATLRVRALMVLGLHDKIEPAEIADYLEGRHQLPVSLWI
jgi:hypothetical protein